MKSTRLRRTAVGAVTALLLSATVASSAEIVVMTSGGFTAPLSDLAPEFERTTKHKVTLVFGASMGGAPDSIPLRLARGEPADLVILTADALDELVKGGKVAPGTRTDLVRSRIGMAVRNGAPKPDISSVDALVRTLLQARSIAYSASASGTYLSTELFPRLGIADQLAPKTQRIVSERVGAVVARGAAEIGFQQISELLPIAGIDYVGPLPDEVQRVSIFAAGIAANAKQPEAARALVDFLASPSVIPTIEKYGLDPIAEPRKSVAGLATEPSFPQLRLVAPAAPGGGWDQTARVMQQVLQRAGLVRTVPVENIPGAAGTIGLARFIGAERGNADTLMVSGLIMLGGIVMHRAPVTLNDVTPIARLTGEYEVIAVPASSPFHALGDFVEALRRRPEALSWGGGSAGGSDQILAGLVAEAVGVPAQRINYIAFSGGGESLSAIIGGQVSVGVNGLAEFAPHIEAGTIRALAISSAHRLPGLEVPTLREQGVDVEFENWRSVVAPPNVTGDKRKRLELLIERMVQSDEWREALTHYRWLDRYMSGTAFSGFVDAEEARVQAILRKFTAGRASSDTLATAGPYSLLVLAGLLVTGVAATFQIKRPSLVPKGQNRFASSSLAFLAGGIVLNVVLAESAGFVVASAVLFWCTARAFDARRPLRDAMFAIALSLGAYLLFARVLQLQLPSGVLGRWL